MVRHAQNVKRLFLVLALSISGVAPAQQKDATYTGSSSLSRTDACREARSSAELFSKNELPCYQPNISIGSCDCEDIPETPRSSRQHKCLIVAKIACVDRSAAPSRPTVQDEVKSFSSTTIDNGTRSEACSGAKKEAEFWAGLNRYSVAGFSDCDCSEQNRIDIGGGLHTKWTCGVDASLRKR